MSTANLSLDKKRKIKQRIEVLRQDTRNIDLWLELESLFEDPDKKREILNGVLLIDAQNPEALERLNRLKEEKSSRLDPDPAPIQSPVKKLPSKEIEKPEIEKAGWRLEDPKPPSEAAQGGEVKTQVCPYCGGKNRADAINCDFCKKPLKENVQAEPEFKPQIKSSGELPGWLKTAVIVFIVLGVIAVIAMIARMIIPLF